MKNLLPILILILTLQTSTLADDIRDFQIEGMSIGDSALDFFTKDELNNSFEIYNYKKNKFRYYFLSYSKAKDYEYLQITTKPKDKNFIIFGVQGHIFYENNIKDCYKKMNSVKEDIDEVLGRKAEKDLGKHPVDKTGKSKFTRFTYYLSNGNAEIICYDMSNKLEKKGKYDRFAINLDSEELKKFLTHEAYK